MISKSFLFFDGSVLLFRSQTKPSTFPLLSYLNIFWYNQIWQNNRFRYSIKCFDILSPVCNNRKRVATSWRSELYHVRRERFSFLFSLEKNVLETCQCNLWETQLWWKSQWVCCSLSFAITSHAGRQHIVDLLDRFKSIPAVNLPSISSWSVGWLKLFVEIESNQEQELMCLK